MIVHYYTEVDMGADAVSKSLAAMTEEIGWIGGAAYRKGEELHAQIGPARPVLAKTVTLEVGPMDERGDTNIFPIAWWATGASGLFPRMEGEIAIAPLNAHRARISFQGNYQPPFGKVGRMLDRSILGRVADSTVKDWIDSLASALTRA